MVNNWIFLDFLNHKICYIFCRYVVMHFFSPKIYLKFLISKTLFRLDFNLDDNGEMVNLESFKIWQHFFLVTTPGTP